MNARLQRLKLDRKQNDLAAGKDAEISEANVDGK